MAHIFPPDFVTNATSASDGGWDVASSARPLKQFFLCAILVVLIIATIIGNLLVIVAILLVPKLRRPENLLILNLAFADELVATLVMPVALVYEVMAYWPFGRFICDVWVSVDVTVCSASILSLCVISLDRYFVISRPLRYGPKRTTRRMVLSILGVWALSAVISLPPLFYFGNQTTGNQCFVSQEPFYQVYATVTAFYAPVILMIIAYGKIYQAARKISEDDKHFMYIQPRRPSAPKKSAQSTEMGTVTRMLMPGRTVTQPLLQQKPPPPEHTADYKLSKKSSYYSREVKAFRTLTAIAVAFLVSWLPFFVLALIRPFHPDIPKWATAVTLWLGYVNSTVNPVLYSIFNKDFRRPFAELLKCRCWTLRKTIRAESYEAQFGTQASFRSVSVAASDSRTKTPTVDM